MCGHPRSMVHRQHQYTLALGTSSCVEHQALGMAVLLSRLLILCPLHTNPDTLAPSQEEAPLAAHVSHAILNYS